MKKFILLVILLATSITVSSLEIELEVIEESLFICHRMYFLDDNVLILSSHNSILKYNLENKTSDVIYSMDNSGYEYKSFGASRSSTSDKVILISMSLVEKDLNSLRKRKYLKLFDNEMVEISKDEFYKDWLRKDFKGKEGARKPWTAELLGDYQYTFEGEMMEVLPYITKKEDKSTKKYFINRDLDINNEYFKPIANGMSSVDISSDKFRIAMLGWTTENRSTGSYVGKYKGLFIFRIIYDGVVNDNSTIYNIDNDGLLVEKEQLLSYTDVKVKDIKQVGDFKYYYIEYGENKSGYILENNIDIQ